ncbi:gliding motility-associated ABC transporter permease subunit GldF [Pedobacter sp. JY14-1]|uniref:gliding motility-associated ABC transporter permease subunit GldF n=1 Tax=Pedobacter sp. JY14-1 TaxID=3034151 RepID=UPI0023E10DD8|nr:gliding motility-associated ABC transporter permease subunit GldF [Pedobacter sp. JY14-1]
MYAVFKRELFGLLNSMMAYITIGIFLLASGLLFWVFPQTSVLDYGYAELTGFFELLPFLFIFMVPAITMRSFAEERREGTFVLLATRPLTDWQILSGKYFSCLALVLLALIPTLLCYFTVYHLALPTGNVDSGAIAGSYVGLLLLGGVFAAIGIFTSSLARNQVVAFAVAVFICFFLFSGLDALSGIFGLRALEGLLLGLSVSEHYRSLSRGVLDTRDLVYFITVAAFFLGMTRLVLGGRKW